ncbi:MAG: FixH family protein [Bacteroidota bacterium]
MRRLPLLLLLAVGGCVPDGLTDFDFQALQPEPPPAELTGEVEIGTAEAEGLTVALSAERGGAHLGYVRLGVRVSEGGAAVPGARVTLSATADAGPAAGVALPVEAPTADAEGVLRGAVFLVTPDTTARQFTVRATVEAGGRTAEVAFPVEARNDLWMQPAGDLVATWVDPLRPIVGENRYVVAVHWWTGTAFEPVEGAEADLYPYMDMGGGDGHSTPYREAEAGRPGHYAWDVDFIMSGGWEMTVFVTPPGGARETARFVGYTVYEP